MNNTVLADYDLKLRQLRTAYLQRNATTLATLQRQLGKVRSGDAVAHRELLMFVHRAHGSGAILGFPQISAVALTLETLLRSHADEALTAAQWQQLEAQLAALALTVQAAEREHSAASVEVNKAD